MATQAKNISNQDIWWKRAWRQVIARPAFWRRRLADEQDERQTWNPFEQIPAQVVAILALAVFVLLPALYLTQVVFLYPGGVPALLGQQLASVCQTTGRCDFNYLMAGLAFGIIVSIVITVYLVKSFMGGWAPAHGWEQDTAAIDSRIVHLRNDLIAAGIPLPREAEDTDTEEDGD